MPAKFDRDAHHERPRAWSSTKPIAALHRHPPLAVHVMHSQHLACGRSRAGAGRRRRGLGFLLESLTVIVLGVLLAVGLHVFVTQVYAISGQSMEPTFRNGERVIIHKLSPGWLSIDHGDVLIFASPNDPSKNLIKRVIALPGEHVHIESGKVYIDEKELDESYVRRELTTYAPRAYDWIVPPDHVFVMGDNRAQSQDSRHFGFVPQRDVKGKVFLRVWPIESFDSIP
ncbi:MAG: signal peptidase I [Planctomycetota bacterium]